MGCEASFHQKCVPVTQGHWSEHAWCRQSGYRCCESRPPIPLAVGGPCQSSLTLLQQSASLPQVQRLAAARARGWSSHYWTFALLRASMPASAALRAVLDATSFVRLAVPCPSAERAPSARRSHTFGPAPKHDMKFSQEMETMTSDHGLFNMAHLAQSMTMNTNAAQRNLL
jgi:hypothetical protein